MHPERKSGSQASTAAFRLPPRHSATTAYVAPSEARVPSLPSLMDHAYHQNPMNLMVWPSSFYRCWVENMYRDAAVDTSTAMSFDIVIEPTLKVRSSLHNFGEYRERLSEGNDLKLSRYRRIIDQKSELINMVFSFRNLGKNWGETGSVPPTENAIRDAILFIDLLPANVTKPQVSIAADGEINFFWRSNGVYIDIGFFGDDMIDYYASVDSQGIDEDASLAFSRRSLPRNLVAAITVA